MRENNNHGPYIYTIARLADQHVNKLLLLLKKFAFTNRTAINFIWCNINIMSSQKTKFWYNMTYRVHMGTLVFSSIGWIAESLIAVTVLAHIWPLTCVWSQVDLKVFKTWECFIATLKLKINKKKLLIQCEIFLPCHFQFF